MRTLLTALAFLAAAPAARAEINLVDSLEWMTVDSPLIVRGKVLGSGDTGGPGAVVYRDVKVRVQDALKGDPGGQTVTVRLRLVGADQTASAWARDGHSFLFFLRKGQDEGDAALTGRWVLRETRQSAIDLNRPKGAYTADMRRARDSAEILRLVRRYAARKPPRRAVGAPNIFKAQDGYLRLEIPFDAPFFSEVFAGSTCYINVPVEAKHRPLALARARSADLHERAAGADLLRNFPGEDTVKLLRALLRDPGESRWTGQNGELVRISYPVRAAAYDSLRALGEAPERPVLERPPSAEEVRKARQKAPR
jgi:hypothetical protein